MTKAGPLDEFERTVRFTLGIVLMLLAWGFGWTGVEGVGALVLGVVALATSFAGYCVVDKALAKLQ